MRHSRDRMGKTKKERCGMKKKRILCSLMGKTKKERCGMKKKRILCGLLTLAMLMALLTVTAFAEDAALTLPPEGGELASGT